MNNKNIGLGMMLALMGGMGLGRNVPHNVVLGESDPDIGEKPLPAKPPREQYRSHEVGSWKGDGIPPPESRQQRRARLNKERAAEPQ